MIDKFVNLDDILTSDDNKNIERIKKDYQMQNNDDFVYVKDFEGFVTKIEKSKLTNEYVVISQEEWEEKSGEKYYKKKFGRGGFRKGAGRKPKTGVVLEFQIRVSKKEKEFINYARQHNLDYDSLMQG